MSRIPKFIPWILPLLGLGLGYVLAFIDFNGLLQTWKLVGKPGQDIVRIVGIRDGQRLLVETGSGTIFSFVFFDQGRVALPSPFRWEVEQSDAVDLISPKNWGGDYVKLPP
jgi:hypothetical protein